ncbi:MAG: hypothetical protein Ta2D_00840 [Rickettsiales bacterium]|nr:MAG: hypothetical protein Ta2D_00840 [Rickettsiales bacterium]
MVDKDKKDTDIISIVVNFLTSKSFKGIAMSIFIAVVLYNKAGVDVNDAKKVIKEKKEFKIIPQNANIRNMIISNSKNKEIERQERRQEELDKAAAEKEEERKAIETKEDFRDKPDKKKKLKKGDLVLVRMTLAENEQFKMYTSPYSFNLVVDKSNEVGKRLIGKYIGSVITVPAKYMLNGVNLNKEMREIQKTDPDLLSPELAEKLRETDVNKMVQTSTMIYKFKVVDYAKITTDEFKNKK